MELVCKHEVCWWPIPTMMHLTAHYVNGIIKVLHSFGSLIDGKSNIKYKQIPLPPINNCLLIIIKFSGHHQYQFWVSYNIIGSLLIKLAGQTAERVCDCVCMHVHWLDNML